MTRSKASIRLDALQCGFHGRPALGPLSLTVEPGEFVVFVGESGCGKTTLLRAVSGLIPPTAGAVEVAPGEIGFVFQKPTLLPWRTVLENVLLPTEVGPGAGTSAARTTRTAHTESTAATTLPQAPAQPPRAHALRLLSLLGLDGEADRLPRQLSGGMQQRVAIARALLLSPSILLLDEPFAALDALTREQLHLDLLRIWAESRATILFVTHDITEAVFLADRVITLTPRPGRIQAETRITLPRPRTPDLRYSPELGALAAEVRQALERGRAL